MRVTPQPRRAQICPVVGYPTRQRRRLIKVMAVNRGVPGKSVVDPANQLGLVSPMALEVERKRARLFGDFPLQVRHSGKSVPARYGVYLSIPGTAAKAVI